MNTAPNQRRWGLMAAVAIALLAIGPQLWFVIDRGGNWHRSNAITHTDEVAYSAYVSSLISGRPRRNDPYTGRQDSSSTAVPESLFSIQMVPAYAVAAPARLLGLSTRTIFIFVPVLCALASAFAIFWLISNVSGDRRVGAAGVCVVLGLGTLFARQGLIRYIPTLPFLIPQWISEMVQSPSVFHLPFLRFYQPAIGFPLFFVLCGFVWKALTDTDNRKAIWAASLGAITFAVLVFTYFFLWTAAAAWLFCVFTLWFIVRGEARRRTLQTLAIVSVVTIPTLAVYFWMLSRRGSTVDAAQALVATHRPDLFRLPELMAMVTLLVLMFGVMRGVLRWRSEGVLFAAAFALSIVLVFNQQIVTGRSLQPFHYEWFIGNYCAGLALMLTLSLLSVGSKRAWLTNKRLAIVAVVALIWALGEVSLAATLNRGYNDHIDDGQMVAERLRELSSADGTLGAEQNRGSLPVVLVADLKLADRLPTDAPQAVLWAPHMLVFPGVTESENQERFYKQLYYLGFDEKRIYTEIDRGDWTFYAGLFPYYRLSPVTRGNAGPITPEELRAKIQQCIAYSGSFSRTQATTPELNYLVVDASQEPSFANIDRWYERDRGEIFGKFALYRLKLKH